ncbi:MAG TPA: Gfo/Idh/MocA family oxidoreductase [Candidatus Brocadiia bacterium]|nr:Gfo/Idh/MocA family oxidoreductase [Candidatus Brocadiia bacterium]
MTEKTISRRRLLGASLKAAATFTIVPRYVLGSASYIPPSENITRGVIGTGSMGIGAHVFENKPGKAPLTLAVCDVDENHLAEAMRKAARGCDAYRDFRRVLERKDIDVIHVATPPHWHALITIAAAQAGKDVLCEKPMHRFIREGQAVIDALNRYGRVFQIGTYNRFGGFEHVGWSPRLRKICRSGILGKPLTVRITGAMGFEWKVQRHSGIPNPTLEAAPKELDYNMWLGPAPWKPYHRHRVHGSFRGYWDYDGGGLTDMGQHFLDPVQYFLDKDHTSPVEIEAEAPWPVHPDAVGVWGRIVMKYEDGDTIILESGEWGTPREAPDAPLIEGPKGRIYPQNRTDPPGLFELLDKFPEEPRLIPFYNQAIKERKQAGGNAEVSHRSTILLHIANIAIRTGRKLRFDPITQTFPGDDEANRLIDVPMRAPWHL